MEQSRGKILKLLSVFIFLINITANYLAVVGVNFLIEYIMPASQRINDTIYAFVSILVSFAVPIISIIAYTYPMIALLKPDSAITNKARIRFLNSPLVISSIGIVGWLIAIISAFLYYFINVTPFPYMGFFRNALINLIAGIFTFILSFYSLEFLFRKYFMDFFFPDNVISKYNGIIRLSLYGRFIIYFFSITVTPLLIYVILFLNIPNLSENLKGVFLNIFVLSLIIGLLLTFLISKSFNSPLLSMTNIAKKIQEGEFDISVKVTSADEIGILAEALNETAHSLKEKEVIKDTFGKFVDPKVRDHLLKGELKLGGEIRKASIVFTDIRGFTSLSEQYSPGTIVYLLNQYFTSIGNCVLNHGGLINKFIGDAVLAVFGAPVALENPSQSAVIAALEMRKALQKLNQKLLNEGYPELHIGIGIHYGEALIGNIGMEARLEYTVIGDAVNIASRVESLCKEFKVDLLLTEATVQNLEPSIRCKFLSESAIRGKKEKVKLFTIEQALY